MIKPIAGNAPSIEPSTWVAETAAVMGRVTIGANVGVFYGAVIRADLDSITIGEGSNIQDGSVLHADPGFPLTIGTGVSVGHNATLHGCTVGDDVLIGMGATVLNGATIGSGSLVAANALVVEGVEIPPNSLVAGVPAKVRRELRPEEVENIRLNAAAYLHLKELHE